MIDVVKLLDFCEKHIQFYVHVLSEYLYDYIIYKTQLHKLDLIACSFFLNYIFSMEGGRFRTDPSPIFQVRLYLITENPDTSLNTKHILKKYI